MLAHQGLLGDLIAEHCQQKKMTGQSSGNRLGRTTSAKSKVVANGNSNTSTNQKSPTKAGGRKKKGRNNSRKRK